MICNVFYSLYEFHGEINVENKVKAKLKWYQGELDFNILEWYIIEQHVIDTYAGKQLPKQGILVPKAATGISATDYIFQTVACRHGHDYNLLQHHPV